jgi:hypothetical protein
MSFVGKKGDTVHIPSPTRGTASLKAITPDATKDMIMAASGEAVAA